MTEREKLIKLIETGTNLASKKAVEETARIVKENHHYNSATDKTVSISEMLADYLLENGVIVLPLNMIGNTLWFINCDDNIVCDKIDGITISDRHDVYIFLQNSDDESYELSDIGKFLFYTREEAEKALAERKNENETR